MDMLKYPVDTASFQRIREEGYLYVDKTEYVYQLVRSGTFYFLGRPRRFGKSLLLSTLAAYFEGRRDLFHGLAIDRLQPEPWEEYPVLRLDLSAEAFTSGESVGHILDDALSVWEERFGIKQPGPTPSVRFKNVIRKAAESSGKRVVVLIDEYDSPLSSAIDNKELFELYREQLHGFYAVLKAMEDHIRFCILTGVTRFGKVSVFSGLNNLRDITMENEFAGICGITKAELHSYFSEGIEKLAKEEDWSVEETYSELKRMYDGYHFSRCMLDIYNPYSVLNALMKRMIGSYWCASGVPTLLAKAIKSGDFDLQHLSDQSVSQEKLENLSAYQNDAVALFYQTGYLTIKDYDREDRTYTLGYPNREVESIILG